MTVLIFFLITCIVVIVMSLENQPHAFRRCSTCHESETVTRENARRLTAPVTRLCTETCHRSVMTRGYLHPVDIKPVKVHIPADMPLSLHGEIACSTCHDIHSEFRTSLGDHSHFLRRRIQGREFCRACHKYLTVSRAGHGGALGEAHFQARYVASDPSQEIDAMSKNCISCHDGSFASSPTIMAGSWTHQKSFVKNDGGSHPIGVDYEACRLKQGRKTDLRPMTAVDWRIRFFQGKIGCGSCHDPYSLIPKRLVMSDRHSQLCISCHMI